MDNEQGWARTADGSPGPVAKGQAFSGNSWRRHRTEVLTVRRSRRLLTALAPRTRRGVVGLPLTHALCFATPFLLDTEGVARAEAFDLSIARWWEEENFIDLGVDASRRQYSDERAAHGLSLLAVLPW